MRLTSWVGGLLRVDAESLNDIDVIYRWSHTLAPYPQDRDHNDLWTSPFAFDSVERYCEGIDSVRLYRADPGSPPR